MATRKVPPPHYVAGLGRGATGFTTRSDIGPARMAPEVDFGQAPAGYVPGVGRGIGMGVPMDTSSAPPHGGEQMQVDEDRFDYSESNYNEFSGYGGSIWNASDPYEKDDEAADRAYEAVENRMKERRNKRKLVKQRETMRKYRAANPKIQTKFADVKKGLADVTMEQWENIPEIGDHTQRYKKTRPDRFTPVPDSIVLEGAAKATGSDHDNIVRTGQSLRDLTQIGSARKTVVSSKLKQVSDSVTGQTVVDSKGYLTDLNSIKISTEAEIGDIKKARLLLKSVTTTNPQHGPGWIAAARLEEVAGRVGNARRVILKGCRACPKTSDVWLEAARLHSPQNAKTILARAVRHCPQSVKLWMAAADLEMLPTTQNTTTKTTTIKTEDDDTPDLAAERAKTESCIRAKRLVLRKALEFIPTSAKLWRAAVELESPDDARVMLARAVECVPHNVEMWLALAKLETYENAKLVLNTARETIPTDASIWITAAKLEEAHGDAGDAVRKIIQVALESLKANQVDIERERWLSEAEAAEKSSFPITCRVIVEETIGIGIEPQDRKVTWVEDADAAVARGSIETARTIYNVAVKTFPKKKSVWMQYAWLEKNSGTPEKMDQLLERAVRYCPQAEILWLMRAKENWLAGKVGAARTILEAAFRANPNSERIWLAAVKLERENDEFQRAEALLKEARGRAGTEKVWVKSAELQRMLGQDDNAEKLIKQALAIYPRHAKLWHLLTKITLKKKNYSEARRTLQRGIINCPRALQLWLTAAGLEETLGRFTHARALLEKGRLNNPKNEQLWLRAVEVEEHVGGPQAKNIAAKVMAKALQECPDSGILWAKAIAMEPIARRKSRSVDALKKCNSDAYVLVAVAKIFWMDRKLGKARDWLERALDLQPEIGDHWAVALLLEQDYAGDDDAQVRVVEHNCDLASPTQGVEWRKVSKIVRRKKLDTKTILHKVADAIRESDPMLYS